LSEKDRKSGKEMKLYRITADDISKAKAHSRLEKNWSLGDPIK
jgi:hypothetical protein